MSKNILLIAAATALLSACSSTAPKERDSTKPTVSLMSINEIRQAGEVKISASASDNVAVKQVEFLLDGQPILTDQNSPYEATLSFTALNNGAHTLKAVATDTAGNQASTEQTFSVSIPQTPVTGDTVAPVIDLILPPSVITAPDTYRIGATATDNVGVTFLELKIDTPLGAQTVDLLGESGNVYSLPVVSSLFNGTYHYTVTAKDAAGNTSVKTGSITVQLP